MQSNKSNSAQTQEDQEPITLLRERLAWLKARHDHGAWSPATFAVVRSIEVEIAWREHELKS